MNQSIAEDETLDEIKYSDLKIEEQGEVKRIATPYSVPTLSKVIEQNQLGRSLINTPTLTEDS